MILGFFSDLSLEIADLSYIYDLLIQIQIPWMLGGKAASKENKTLSAVMFIGAGLFTFLLTLRKEIIKAFFQHKYLRTIGIKTEKY